MSKLYFSKISDPEKWCDDMETFWFPFAERLAKTRLGWAILNAYISFRLWLKGVLK